MLTIASATRKRGKFYGNRAAQAKWRFRGGRKNLINSTLSKSQSSNSCRQRFIPGITTDDPVGSIFTILMYVWQRLRNPWWLFCSAFACRFANRSRTRRSEEQFLRFSFSLLEERRSVDIGFDRFFSAYAAAYTTTTHHIVNRLFCPHWKHWE